jgi:hypothetical protein
MTLRRREFINSTGISRGIVADSLDEAKAAFQAGVGGGRVRSAFSRNCGQKRLRAGDSVDDPGQPLGATTSRIATSP